MDYKIFFEEINNHWKNQLPFVIYKNPNENSLSAILQQTDDLITDLNFTTSGFVFGPFNYANNSVIWFPESASKRINSQLDTNFNFEPPINFNEAINAKEKHISILKKAKLELLSGVLQKVVISRSENVAITKITPIEWFQRMCYLYPNAYTYCWYHPKVGMWLGATPETLISLKETSFNTMALAGTMPYRDTENVNWGIKEKEEQQMVVDSMLKALQPIAENLEKGTTKTQKAGSLLHLKTLILGKLNDQKKLKTLVEVLHPTSAICGLPKQKAKGFILKNEDYDREYYTGYLGTFNPDSNTRLFVNLRCMKIEENSVKIFIGGGITAASNIELEWQETVNKSQIMKRVL